VFLARSNKPIAIGRLQRHAMDFVYAKGNRPVPTRESHRQESGDHWRGPRGVLSCAGELTKRGHSVTLFEKRDLAGGLSTYGIIGLREPAEVARAEVAMIERLGVKLETGKELGADFTIGRTCKTQLWRCVSQCGSGCNARPWAFPAKSTSLMGWKYIEQKQAGCNPTSFIGRNVVVIGAGNTAIDCATIAQAPGRQPSHDGSIGPPRKKR